jgi:outer membrane protein assembly factor BamB
LSIDGPLVALDAVTGQTVKTYERTEGTLEVVHSEGALYVVAGEVTERKEATEGLRPGFAHVRPQRPGYVENPPAKRIIALDAETSDVLWSKSDTETVEIMPTTLAVSKGRLFFQNADELFCMDARSGEEIWSAKRPTSRSRPTWSAPTLVVYDDVVLSADRAVAEDKTLNTDGKRKVEWIVSSRGGQAPVGELVAFSAEDGERLWSCPARECYNSPADVLVADGLVWTGSLVRASDPGITDGRDPATGQIKRTRPADKEFFAAGMGHHRCYRNKGTSDYLVLGRSGVEFVELNTGKAIPNHWIRGACQYGVIPANGLLYVPTNPCACFITAKLPGFNCLAPEQKRPKQEIDESADRLEKGPAYNQIVNSQSSIYGSAIVNPQDWPTYRHDNARSSCIQIRIDPDLKPKWSKRIGGKPLRGNLSSVVIAEGRLLVARVDAHTVHAMSAESGRDLWRYTAGGRIDSPPTIWRGLALFGCSDGWVYCLRALDGSLVWRFRAAPADRRILAYGQLESAWPAPGSVLVHDGTAYCAAGRSSYLDGSIRLLRLDAKTGELLSETIIDHRDPETGYQRKGSVHGTNMPGALPDVLSCDGESVFMRHNRFDLRGQPQKADVPHLFSSAGFLEDSWWHRTYWQFGTSMGTNYGGWPRTGNRVPAGRVLAFDDDSIYGFGRSQYIHHGAHVGIDGATIFHFKPQQDAERRFTHYRAFAIERQKEGKKAGKYRWTGQQPVIGRAAVLARNGLFLAGPPDVFSSKEPAATLEGKRGGLLYVLSTEDGSELARHELDSPPVFDGMAGSHGRLYIATTDGKVLCLE